MTARLGQFQQGKMDLQAHTEHRRMDQEKTRPGELLSDSVVNGPHGCYRAYLYKYGHDIAEACPECRNERETAEHVFFTCPRYVNQRNCLERTMGFQVTPDNIVNLMLISCDKTERSECLRKV